MKEQAPDHIAVTGDLVNLSLARRISSARERGSKRSGAPRDVTVIPGNHDVYVRAVVPSPAAYWGDYMRGDDGVGRLSVRAPARQRGADRALDRRADRRRSWRPAGSASSSFPGSRRRSTRRAACFASCSSIIRRSARRGAIMRRLTDAADLRRVLAEHGAELLMHGHDHERAVIRLDGPGGTKIPAVGVPSASARGAARRRERRRLQDLSHRRRARRRGAAR